MKRNLRRVLSSLVNKSPRIKQVAHKVINLRKSMDITQGFYMKSLINKGFHISIPPEVLLSQEYKKNTFCRYDTIARLITIEYFSENREDAFQLYNKMQSARGVLDGYEYRFKNLLDSIKRTNLRVENSIEVGKDGHLLDGSHRLAIALYLNISLITCRLNPIHRGVVDYRLDWFYKNGFSKEECAMLEERRDRLFWEKGLFFPVILWPTVSEYYDEIERDISENYRIVSTNRYFYNDNEFESIIRAIYAIDDIEKWKIDKKLSGMKKYNNKIMIIWIEFPNPKYRKKGLNNAYISTTGEQLKSRIRNKYKGRVVGYFYDIICHTGDNHEHNKAILNIFDDKKLSINSRNN